MSWRFDCHVHSRHSKDAKGTVLELAMAAQERGLHGFALTDHDTVAGHADIAHAMQATGLLIVPGIEVTTAEGHVLALNVRQPISTGQSLPDTLAQITEQGGLGIAAHPLRMFTGIGPTGLRRRFEEGHIAAVEGRNARERHVVQENTLRVAGALGVPLLGGSDAHWIHDIGTAYTVFDHAPADSVELVSMIRDGLCRPEGASLKRRHVWRHGMRIAVPAKWRSRE